jgi:hypothetical protein
VGTSGELSGEGMVDKIYVTDLPRLRKALEELKEEFSSSMNPEYSRLRKGRVVSF